MLRKLVKLVTIVLCAGMCITPVQANFNYGEALHKSLLFYKAQQSHPADKEVPWRRALAAPTKTHDGKDMSPILADAGDFVSFVLPLSTSWTMLATGMLYYADGYRTSHQYHRGLQVLKYGTDFLKRAVISPTRIVGQVGNGQVDHAMWSRPQDIKTPYPVYELSPNKPGSDVSGAMAAALASSAMVYKYAGMAKEHETCTASAKIAYQFATKYKGYYSDSIPDAKIFYKSTTYRDDLALAAIWLYRATGEHKYAKEAAAWFQEGVDKENFLNDWPGANWASQEYAAAVQLHRVFPKNDVYVKILKKLEDSWFNNKNGVRKTPKGFKFLDAWGSSRHAGNAAFILLTSQVTDHNKAICFARTQAEYILGSTGKSFMVGFGNKYPLRPHHRSASCPVNGKCDWSAFDTSVPNANVIIGAIVGGISAPDDSAYHDKRTDYICNEVAIDYAAPWSGVFAALSMSAHVKCH